jgi:hypothetical protein
MRRPEDRSSAWVAGALLATGVALMLALGGCTWDFNHEPAHSTDHHGRFHAGSPCAVCEGRPVPVHDVASCDHCGRITRR